MKDIEAQPKVATRAKFTVTSVNPDQGTVNFHPVYSDDPTSENGKFFAATPNGEITLRLVRDGVLANFKPGEEFYVDFTPVQQPASTGQATAAVTPTVGRDVHYVSYGTPKGEYTPAHRAAKITDVRESDQFGFEVRACVMNPEGLFFTGWTHFDESGTQGGTVHWPERV
ncbi:hypothetical protein K7W42_20355 [Deinococcus sp. HMF7604]|uniref:hypothetical protein n=1 Tax=Deinococcus betulae TaxID=2873312 RepID=UPI001CCC4CB9|nr:hypothetical protein [Deinococcus betulae]MBZ9753192.1 hypothetical protein [Deinococcus betulae]